MLGEWRATEPRPKEVELKEEGGRQSRRGWKIKLESSNVGLVSQLMKRAKSWPPRS